MSDNLTQPCLQECEDYKGMYEQIEDQISEDEARKIEEKLRQAGYINQIFKSNLEISTLFYIN